MPTSGDTPYIVDMYLSFLVFVWKYSAVYTVFNTIDGDFR